LSIKHAYEEDKDVLASEGLFEKVVSAVYIAIELVYNLNILGNRA